MPTYCGTSVDTRMAPGDGDAGRNDTLRRGERPRVSHTFGPVGDGREWRARCFEGELQRALLMACGGIWRPYSSLQYRSSALVAVVAC